MDKRVSNKTRSQSQDDENFDNMMEIQKETFDMDDDLYELRRKYMEMKKERQRSEKDANVLASKLKLLNNEEIKMKQKNEKEKRTKEEMEKIRNEILLEKENISAIRQEKESDINNKKVQINQMRENIRGALQTWRINVTEKNKSELEKLKKKKIENNEIILMNKRGEEKKNRDSCENIRLQKIAMSEKKKKEEV